MSSYPSMRSLRAFEAAARHLSIQRAAADLNVTPGAVSRLIQSLEQQIGVELFRRGHRSLAITAEGMSFLADIREPLAAIGNAVDAATRPKRRNAVSLCVYPTFALRWFMPRWSRFYDRHPGIDIRLTTSLSPVDFAHDGHDLAIQMIGAKGGARGLETEKLLDVETTLVCAPRLARKLRRPIDLGSCALLHSEPRPQDWARWLDYAGIEIPNARQGLRFESLNLAFQAAIEGLGVAMAITTLIEADVAAGKLAVPFPRLRRPGRSMGLVYPKGSVRNGNVAVFRDWLLSEAQSPPVAVRARRS